MAIISVAAAVPRAAVRRLSSPISDQSSKLSHFSSLPLAAELWSFCSQCVKPKLRRRTIAPIDVYTQLGHYFHPKIETEIVYVSENVESKKQTFSTLDEELENSDKPVLVEFYATWCGPCQFMFRIVEQVTTSMADKIHIVKIDTDKFRALADKYEIEALPTFILFEDGKPIDRFEGAMRAEQFFQRVDASLQ